MNYYNIYQMDNDWKGVQDLGKQLLKEYEIV